MLGFKKLLTPKILEEEGITVQPVSLTAPQATFGSDSTLLSVSEVTDSLPAMSWKLLPRMFAPLVGKHIQEWDSRRERSFNRHAFGVPGHSLKMHEGVNKRSDISPKFQSLKFLLEQLKCKAEMKAQNTVKFLWL